MRALASLLLLFVLAPIAAHAQVPVRTTSVAYVDPAVSPADATWIASGVRRGLGEIVDVDYVHPVDAVQGAEISSEVESAIGLLDEVAADLRAGETGRLEQLREAIAVLDASLPVVQRTTLADAYVLRAIGECARRRFTPCERGFRQVLTFRESFEYDTTRYPEEFSERFEQQRTSLLETGARTSLDVVVEPEGAEVFIDGRSLGPSPARTEDLLVGDHYLTVLAQGYEKYIERVRVAANGGRADVSLTRSERALAIEQGEERIREELTQERLDRSSAIVGLRGTLDAQRVIFVVLRPAGAEIEVGLYAFDLQTRARIATLTQNVPPGPGSADATRDAIAQLYARGQRRPLTQGPVAPPPPADDDGEIYEQWWFWTAIGAVVVTGAVVTGVIVLGEDDGGPPEGWTRIDGRVR